YIESFPADVQVVLEDIRRAIRKAVPNGYEMISYNIPTVKINDKLVIYFAGWKTYVSVYPVPAVDEDLEQEIAPYRAAKSTLRFPLRKPIPYDLITRLATVSAQAAAQR